MGSAFYKNYVLNFALLLSLWSNLPFSYADSPKATLDPYAGSNLEDENAAFRFKKKQGADTDTIRLIDQQNKENEARNKSAFDQQRFTVSGQSRAEEMVNALRNVELQKAMGKATNRGNQMLEENPELRNPLIIVASAFGLWAGNTIKLIRGEQFKLFSRVEARNKSGEFRMESPILNGKLLYQDTNGVQIHMNRSIKSIDSNAALIYTARTQAVGGEVSHTLIPHIDLSFGASQSPQNNQTDTQGRIDYRLSF